MDMKIYKRAFEKLYGTDRDLLAIQIKRYQKLDKDFLDIFDNDERLLFSTPGRTELGGNHTDHNNGLVLAASVNLDSIAVAAKNESQKIVLYSDGFSLPFEIDLSSLKKEEKEKGSTHALIRGIAFRFKQLGYNIGGFDACMSSDVLPGSGLSSSASIEVLIGSIFNNLFNDGTVSEEIVAQIGQYAENEYFGKPCGLMDQMACAIGGIISIDFVEPKKPQIEKIVFDICNHSYSLLIVDTGGNHADLTKDYASIPEEMKSVATEFNKSSLRELDEQIILENASELRKSVGDRAFLRALHYFEENNRVGNQVRSLISNNFKEFLNLIQLSGNSSFKLLQNIYTNKNIHGQGVTLALTLTEKYISSIGEGACRVHGGGFAGTIQVFLPENSVERYIGMIEKVFEKGCVKNLIIRPYGTICINNLDKGN